MASLPWKIQMILLSHASPYSLSSFPLSLQTPKLKLLVKNKKLLREQKEWSLVSCRLLGISPLSPKQLFSLQIPWLSPVVVQLLISKRQCWWLLCQLTVVAKNYNTLSSWFPLCSIIYTISFLCLIMKPFQNLVKFKTVTSSFKFVRNDKLKNVISIWSKTNK